MSMIIDTRRSLDTDTVDKISAAEDRVDSNADRNAVQAYRRLIRKISGEKRVTCHMVEHDPIHFPTQSTVAFGRTE